MNIIGYIFVIIFARFTQKCRQKFVVHNSLQQAKLVATNIKPLRGFYFEYKSNTKGQ